MKAAIRRIDRALKDLNNLDQTLRAEDFLLAPKEGRAPAGALYIQEQGDDVSVGIYLNSGVARELGTFPKWKMGELTLDQKRAFAVASEEVSHFHYLLFHLAGGRAVSRLEMELQGEVDTFLLSYFASAEAGKEDTAFETAFAQAFEHFRLVESLAEGEKDRYLEANQSARDFVKKLWIPICRGRNPEEALKLIRRFYRLNLAEKMTLAAA